MANMSLGDYTFEDNPSEMPLLNPEKSCALEETYTSAAFFDWGTDIAGKEVPIKWTYMSATMFAELEEKAAEAGPLVFDPQNGSGKTYYVQVKSPTGKYLHSLAEAPSSALRKDVELVLFFLGEVP